MKPEIDWAKFRWDHLPTDEEVWELVDVLIHDTEHGSCCKCGKDLNKDKITRIRQERFHYEWSMPESRACGFEWEGPMKFVCQDCDQEVRAEFEDEEEIRGKQILYPSGRCMCMNYVWPDEVDAVKAKHKELYEHDTNHEMRIDAGLNMHHDE